VALVIPKYQQSAVSRNRLKRRLREIMRLAGLLNLPAIDVVIQAKSSAYELCFKELSLEVASILERIKTPVIGE
jgi:ribonuclease P protein component